MKRSCLPAVGRGLCRLIVSISSSTRRGSLSLSRPKPDNSTSFIPHQSLESFNPGMIHPLPNAIRLGNADLLVLNRILQLPHPFRKVIGLQDSKERTLPKESLKGQNFLERSKIRSANDSIRLRKVSFFRHDSGISCSP